MTLATGSLTPVQAQLLLNPDAVPGRALVRTAVLHLLALGRLTAVKEAKKTMFGTREEVRFSPRGGGTELPPELRAVLDAAYPPGKRDPLTRTELVQRLQVAFGYTFERYPGEHVRPGLVRRGLLAVEAYKTLWIINRRRHLHTPEGERLRAEIDGRLRQADEVPALLESEPRKAVAAVAGLGGLALIADGLRPHHAAIGEAARAHGADALLPALEEEEREGIWFDVMDIFLTFDWELILDAFDGLGDAFDGGSDGGGGDGGDGGGGGGE